MTNRRNTMKKWNENSSENTGLDQKKKYVKIISKNVLI